MILVRIARFKANVDRYVRALQWADVYVIGKRGKVLMVMSVAREAKPVPQ